VTKHDCVKKEVIQQLCIEPMTHSTLNKALVENVNSETGLEQVIRDVAFLKGPTKQRTSIVYELKQGNLKIWNLAMLNTDYISHC
jgi:E3 ubiquitin-protein ligase UBR2